MPARAGAAMHWLRAVAVAVAVAVLDALEVEIVDSAAAIRSRQFQPLVHPRPMFQNAALQRGEGACFQLRQEVLVRLADDFGRPLTEQRTERPLVTKARILAKTRWWVSS